MDLEIKNIIAQALKEDIGAGDVTVAATIPADMQGTFTFVAREKLVVCGLNVVAQVFAQLSPNIVFSPLFAEGQGVEAGVKLAKVSGAVRHILTAERVALNLIQRMSGVATITQQYVHAVKGTKAIIRDTRKTMPNLRVLDKYAVRIGGGQNHRMRLDDAILIKDNHIAACGSVKIAIAKAKQQNLPITVECDTLEQVAEALAAGVDAILLDNMSPEMLTQAVKQVGGKVKLEASGGITLSNVRQVAETGVDYIAIGALTHSVRGVDIGLDD
jgi:nicotinate-nucleotide pyrophosphorylase (carboxylating)